MMNYAKDYSEINIWLYALPPSPLSREHTISEYTLWMNSIKLQSVHWITGKS